jgi:hypothetical protein
MGSKEQEKRLMDAYCCFVLTIIHCYTICCFEKVLADTVHIAPDSNVVRRYMSTSLLVFSNCWIHKPGRLRGVRRYNEEHKNIGQAFPRRMILEIINNSIC